MAEGLFSKIKGWVIDEEEEEIYEEEMEALRDSERIPGQR